MLSLFYNPCQHKGKEKKEDKKRTMYYAKKAKRLLAVS